MFTIPIKLRFALMAGGLFLGVALTVAYGFWYGFPFLLGSIALTVGYVLLGTVQSASMLIQDQKFDEAEKQLAYTYFPQYLFSANKGYYSMLKGTIAMQKKDNAGAEKHLNQALSVGMPSDNEKAVILMQLSNIAATKSNFTQLASYVKQLKKLKITESMIKEQVKELEKVVKNRGAIRSAGMQGHNRMPSGKRRKPRQR